MFERLYGRCEQDVLEGEGDLDLSTPLMEMGSLSQNLFSLVFCSRLRRTSF